MEKGRILFVDDEFGPSPDRPNGSYMWYYSQALRDAGFEVREVLSPDEALSELSKEDQRFDLIILDIMMLPGERYKHEDTAEGLRTGIFLARTLHERWADIPILVLTNVLNPDVINKMKAIPSIRNVLSKPSYLPFQVLEEVRKM